VAVEPGRKPSQRRERPSAVSLFSGAGGFCEGVRLADYDVVCAVEADRDACRTHSTNFPEVPLFAGDIQRFLRDKRPGIPSKKELTTRGIDLVYGGPPCQGFSQIGPRDIKDPRNLLYRQFTRILKALAPRSFIMENVPNILAMRNGGYRDEILHSFSEAGYKRISVNTLLASDFGVPQDRRRVFFIGVQDDLLFGDDFDTVCSRLLTECRSERRVTVQQAISDLPAEVSPDDKALPYPKRRRGRYAEYQQLMRLDFDTSLLSIASKTARLDNDPELHNHHFANTRTHWYTGYRRLQGEPGDDRLFGPCKVHDLDDALRRWLALHPDEVDRLRATKPSGPLAITHRTGRQKDSLGTGRRFDSVWVSRHWVVRHIEHLYDEGIAAGSDHAPVMVDLDLTARPGKGEET
jgi:DNA (cytosine-5)-methyltransferase 1